jgi:hypothetical protein
MSKTTKTVFETVTATAPRLNPVPLAESDIDLLREHKGWFENGYDNRDAMKVLDCFQSADMVVTWEYLDDGSEAGCSEFIGMEYVTVGTYESGMPRVETTGPWRRIHPDVWTYLSDPECDIDPATIPSLLDTGEFAVFEDQDIADKGFIQNPDEDEDDEEVCIDDDCDEPLDDGEGFDGYCGTHADKIERHNNGGHRPLGKTDDDGDEAIGTDDECPNCKGAGVVWG